MKLITLVYVKYYMANNLSLLANRDVLNIWDKFNRNNYDYFQNCTNSLYKLNYRSK